MLPIKLTWDAPIKREMKQVEEELRKSVCSEEHLLTDICMHVISAGGKRIRPGIALLAYKAVNGKEMDKFIGIAASFELIHSASLIHDDINDAGEIRRGKVAAYKKFGVQKALVAGDFLFVRSFRLGGAWDKRVVEIISDACTATAESEMLQSAHDFDVKTSRKVYIKVIEGKTAKPIEAAALVGAYLGKATEEQARALGDYGLNLGLAFQIIDDVLDIDGNEKELGKPKGIDLTDGKSTLPLILAMNDPEVGKRISKIFVKREKSQKEVKEALSLILRTDAIQTSRRAAQGYSEKANAALDVLPDSPYKKSLKELARVVVSRRT